MPCSLHRKSTVSVSVAQSQCGKGSILASPVNSEKTRRVLLVDPDEAFGNVLEEVLADEGYSIRQVPTPQAALTEIGRGVADSETDVILLNLDCGTENGQSHRYLLSAVSDLSFPLPIISFGWVKHSRSALELFQDGAVDFLNQPLDIQELRFAINRACRRAQMTRELAAAQKILTSSNHVHGLLGNSKPMARVSDVT